MSLDAITPQGRETGAPKDRPSIPPMPSTVTMQNALSRRTRAERTQVNRGIDQPRPNDETSQATGGKKKGDLSELIPIVGPLASAGLGSLIGYWLIS